MSDFKCLLEYTTKDCTVHLFLKKGDSADQQPAPEKVDASVSKATKVEANEVKDDTDKVFWERVHSLIESHPKVTKENGARIADAWKRKFDELL